MLLMNNVHWVVWDEDLEVENYYIDWHAIIGTLEANSHNNNNNGKLLWFYLWFQTCFWAQNVKKIMSLINLY